MASAWRLRVGWLLVLLCACGGLPGGGQGVVLGPTPGVAQQACLDRRAARLSAVVPRFREGPLQTPPPVTRVGDVFITEVGFRLRGARERDATFGRYPPNSFAGRSGRLRLEDRVASGRSEVEVTLTTGLDLSANGPRVQFRAFRQQASGGVTTSNVTMTATGPRTAVRLVTDNSRAQRPLQVGDVLDFELELFFAGFDPRDPTPITGAQQAYSDTFRYRVGAGGLDPEPFDDEAPAALGPSAWLGGALSVPFIETRAGGPIGGATAWEQLALGAPPALTDSFLNGRRRFVTDVERGTHAEPGNEPLPPSPGALDAAFTARSCNTCHRSAGRGQLPPVGQRLESAAAYTDGPLGPVVQRTEAEPRLSEWVEVRREVLADGRSVTLVAPRFDALGDAVVRVAPPLPGLGLLEAVPEATLAEAVDDEDCDGDGVSGRAPLVEENGAVRWGRFGWKATHASLEGLVQHEVREQLGARLDEAARGELVAAVQLFGVPVQRRDARAERGEALFRDVGCARCHLDSLETGDGHPLGVFRRQRLRPFTDGLLHDLGEGLSDGSTSPLAREWRTAALWGLGVARVVHRERHLLHDGRARDVLEAILWHDGEARASVDGVRVLPGADVDALIAFLETL
ncbi:MAG: di-heme oxidoredictase family protein [Myxococcaceae bacterium]|nr:di-heme oxidoredictase family protein [Myxococcaceae bacterium]